MPRHLIVLKLHSPEGTIKLNFGNEDAGHVRLRSFMFRGVNTNSCQFISFGNIATLPVTAGSNVDAQYVSSQEYPMYIDIKPNNTAIYEWHKPVPIMGGDNLMTANQLITYQIKDFNGNLSVFQDLVLVLDFIPRSQYSQVKGDRLIDHKIKTNTTERREAFTQNFNYSEGHRPFFNY